MNIRRANSGIRMASHRLVLREFVVTDEDAVHAFAADPLVTRFTDWDPTASKTPEHSLAEATAWATNPQRAEFRQYLLVSCAINSMTNCRLGAWRVGAGR